MNIGKILIFALVLQYLLGCGPRGYGLYTVEESVDKTFIERWFENSKGNLYKCDVINTGFSNCDFDSPARWKKETNDDDPTKPELDLISEIFSTRPPEEIGAMIEPLFPSKEILRSGDNVLVVKMTAKSDKSYYDHAVSYWNKTQP